MGIESQMPEVAGKVLKINDHEIYDGYGKRSKWDAKLKMAYCLRSGFKRFSTFFLIKSLAGYFYVAGYFYAVAAFLRRDVDLVANPATGSKDFPEPVCF